MTFPPEVTIGFGGGSINCETYAQLSSTQAFNNTGTVTLLSASSPITIEIRGIFQSKLVFDIGSRITIACDKLKNPPTLSPSTSFAVQISNPLAATLTRDTGMAATMT